MIQNKLVRLQVLVTLILFLTSLACGQSVSPTLVGQVIATTEPEATETQIEEPTLVSTELVEVPIQVEFDLDHTTEGLILDTGGDVDTEVVSMGSPPELALRTGNGEALSSSDGNTAEDYFMQFSIDDAFIFSSSPTSRVQIEIEYLDEGFDTFSIQYDAISGGPEGDGRFKDTGVVVKSDSGEFKTTVFPLCDAYFANRTNGGDFRISDSGDGAEIIRRVFVTLVASTSGPVTIDVDSCGANPFDDQPDSDAIQTCIDRACSGDTVQFNSGVNSPGYQGYVIDKTVFLVRTSAKSDLTFTSTDPDNHALLKASPDLLGFVVGLFARSGVYGGDVDNITFNHLDLDGNRAERRCYGANRLGSGEDDNWGSWLPECDVLDDAWCSPGTLQMAGQIDDTDPEQDYLARPERWTTGLVVRDVTITNTECGTALAFWGAEGVIDSVVIDIAGDHVHGPGCEFIDPDEPFHNAWSDGITFAGPAHLITNNLIMDASDIGIVSFGGRDTVISNNTVKARPGNYGMFAGIAVHPWTFGLLSGFQVIGNEVINEADTTCGGIHAGINIGAHMWGAGCIPTDSLAAVGHSNGCSSLSPPPGWRLCVAGQTCQVWGHIPAGATFTLADNTVTGAQVNYVVGGLDVLGELVVFGNVSNSPRQTDWEEDQNCTWDGITDSWSTIDFAAHDPTIEGWIDQRIYCGR